jgi:energy-coupling factor transport system ATP-binding protein
VSLSLDSIGYAYRVGLDGSVPALSDVSFEVSPGEIVLVLGTTGSGKSTLMRLAAGLLALQEGTATIDGAPLDLDSARGRVGLIFQDAESQLFADTLLDDVAFGPRNLGLAADLAREHARSALAAVGLAPEVFAERSPFSLSGGEARRAAIAGVLAMEPNYLLADEPTAGLDARGREAVRQLLGAAKKRAGIVVVSHAAEEFVALADRVVMLAAGRVVWSGTADEAADPAAFEAADLRVPEVLEIQRLAAARGIQLAGFSFDPVEAAERLVAALAAGECT